MTGHPTQATGTASCGHCGNVLTITNPVVHGSHQWVTFEAWQAEHGNHKNASAGLVYRHIHGAMPPVVTFPAGTVFPFGWRDARASGGLT